MDWRPHHLAEFIVRLAVSYCCQASWSSRKPSESKMVLTLANRHRSDLAGARLGGGMDSHVRGLLRGLAAIDRDNQYFLFTTHANHNSFEVLPTRCERILFRAAHHTVASRLLSRHFRLAARISRYRLTYCIPLALLSRSGREYPGFSRCTTSRYTRCRQSTQPLGES